MEQQPDSTVAATGDLTADEAETLVEQIATAGLQLWRSVISAYQGRAWIALGYTSWDELCEQRFHTMPIRLPREERQDVIASLTDAGLSQRAIAAATGTSRNTVAADQAEVAQTEPPDGPVTPDEVIAPTPTTGTDGKTYTKPTPEQREQRAAERAAKQRRQHIERMTRRVTQALAILDDLRTDREHAEIVSALPKEEQQIVWRYEAAVRDANVVRMPSADREKPETGPGHPRSQVSRVTVSGVIMYRCDRCGQARASADALRNAACTPPT